MSNHLNFIVGNSEDFHAVAVKWALKQLGQDCLIWDGIGADECDQVSFNPGSSSKKLIIGETNILEQGIGSLWIRRPVKYRPINNVAGTTAKFVEDELSYSYLNLVSYLKRLSNFTICTPFRSEADAKSCQLDLASSIGLNVPKTLISNNYKEVIEFSKRIGKTIYKPFNPFFWHSASTGQHRIAATMILDNLDDIQEESIALTPGIYQEYIDKDYELRVTVIGDQIFAAKIGKNEGRAFVDWRFNIYDSQAVVEETELSDDLKRKIFVLISELGLKYGCLDFAVIGEKPYFLEVNPSGQFLFIEHFIPEMPLLAAFTSFMANQSMTYQIHEPSVINLRNFLKTKDHDVMQSLRGKVAGENTRRLNI